MDPDARTALRSTARALLNQSVLDLTPPQTSFLLRLTPAILASATSTRPTDADVLAAVLAHPSLSRAQLIFLAHRPAVAVSPCPARLLNHPQCIPMVAAMAVYTSWRGSPDAGTFALAHYKTHPLSHLAATLVHYWPYDAEHSFLEAHAILMSTPSALDTFLVLVKDEPLDPSSANAPHLLELARMSVLLSPPPE